VHQHLRAPSNESENGEAHQRHAGTAPHENALTSHGTPILGSTGLESGVISAPARGRERRSRSQTGYEAYEPAC